MAENNKRKKEDQSEVYEKKGSTPLPAFGLAEDILGKNPIKVEKSSEMIDRSFDSGNGSTSDEGLMKFVTFFLESEEYALPISKVQEIKRIGEITRMPNAPSYVRGVMNLRGKVVPVIELKHRLNLGQINISKESRIVVVEHASKILGLMVDKVSQVMNITSDKIENVPEEVVQVQENYIQGVGRIDDRMIILLDLEKVIGKQSEVY